MWEKTDVNPETGEKATQFLKEGDDELTGRFYNTNSETGDDGGKYFKAKEREKHL